MISYTYTNIKLYLWIIIINGNVLIIKVIVIIIKGKVIFINIRIIIISV